MLKTISVQAVLIKVVVLSIGATLSFNSVAGKPEKTLVCHVGNELSSIDETYLENPECTPPGYWNTEIDGEFKCPDAGKIDLILVSEKAKHGENHSFNGDSDYAPLKENAGDDPADFEDNSPVPDGIDDGCEPEEQACPCWTTHEVVQAAVINSTQGGATSRQCLAAPGVKTQWPAVSGNNYTSYLFLSQFGSVCQYSHWYWETQGGSQIFDDRSNTSLTTEQAAACRTDVQALQTAGWCTQ